MAVPYPFQGYGTGNGMGYGAGYGVSLKPYNPVWARSHVDVEVDVTGRAYFANGYMGRGSLFLVECMQGVLSLCSNSLSY